MMTPRMEPKLDAYSMYRESLQTLVTECDGAQFDFDRPLSFVIVGATGKLATKKIFPALWMLYRDKLLPKDTTFYAYARGEFLLRELRHTCQRWMEPHQGEREQYEAFWGRCVYMLGKCDNDRDFERLDAELIKREKVDVANRVFYLALPPMIYEQASTHIKNACLAKKGKTRIILEKPYGRDLKTTQHLSDHLRKLFKENEIYRIDHYLGKEMIQSLMTLRFANRILNPTWNCEHIQAVQISFKEIIGIVGRRGYFDSFGIIRDVMQTDLLQILSLIAMEQPASCNPDDIRNEKMKLLRCVKPLRFEDVVLGQYVGNSKAKGEAKRGYLDDEMVPKNSTTPTYALGILYINNDRWRDVPFILKCGKALDERKVEVRVQYKNVEKDIFHGQPKRNEVVIRFQPNDALQAKVMVNIPGMTFNMEESSLNLNYGEQYTKMRLFDTYQRLILDVLCGIQMHFMRTDELKESFRIFSPVLEKIEEEKIVPIPYIFGSRGPREADEKVLRHNFQYARASTSSPRPSPSHTRR